MRAVFAAFVIVAIKAATGKRIQEYVNTKHHEVIYDVTGPKRTAQLINYSNVRIKFRQVNVGMDYALHMEAVSIEGLPRTRYDNPCGPWIGVQLDDGQEYLCNITRFGVETDSDANFNIPEMQFIIFFQCGGMPNVLLEIPLLQIPASVRLNALGTWAKQQHVGMLSPVSMQQLSRLRSSKELDIEFTWLSQVLEYGVQKGRLHRRVGEHDVDKMYRTHWIVLEKDSVSKLLDEVEYFQADDDIETFDTNDDHDVSGYYDRLYG